MKGKRIFAYLIDMVLISVLSSILFSLPIFEDAYNSYNSVFDEFMVSLTESGSSDITDDELVIITYNIQKATQPMNIINAGLLVMYFGVFAYLFKGQTLGKKIFKIQVVPNNGNRLNAPLFMLRSVLVTNFIPKVCVIICTCFLTGNVWYSTVSALEYLEYFLIFLMIGFMIFRDDERGLHDIICNTKVVDFKAEE